MDGKGRFIVVVLDSFGVGAMDDVLKVRPQDNGSNTCLHLIESDYKKEWDTLCSMGLINTLREPITTMPRFEKATWGTSNLMHFGADSYNGHQEIVGTKPKKPVFSKIQYHLDDIEKDLKAKGYDVKRITKNGLQVLKVNDLIFVGDNMETDLGQAINVIGDLDNAGFDLIKTIGMIVRKHVKVSRVIAYGGENVHAKKLEEHIITVNGEFIGIDAPSTGVYEKNYTVIHIGYGVDFEKQVPNVINKKGVKSYFYGKTADIINNPNGKSFSCIDTEDTFDELLKDMDTISEGFMFLNIQETDLAGHAEDLKRYVDRVNVSDIKIRAIIDKMNINDILIVMADHGNDPTIGHAKHTRERVPILITGPKIKQGVYIGNRKTMADIGQTVAEYYGCELEFGTSFLKNIT